LTDAVPGRKAPKILCAGIAVQDIVMRVENFPAPGAKVSASEFIITGGGCAANAAVAIARLGGRAAFAGPLGGTDDQASNRILTDLAKEGIDCGGAVRVAGGTASVSLILLDATGEKTIATRRGVNLGKVLPVDADRLVADVDAVLIDQAGRPAAQARQPCGGVGGSLARHDWRQRPRRRLAAPGRACLRLPRQHRRAERRLLA
jgi:sugar/nucleoside kinase (ribokinase family)